MIERPDATLNMPAIVRIADSKASNAPPFRLFPDLYHEVLGRKASVALGVGSNPVNFPGFASVVRKGLLKTTRARCDIANDKTYQDGPTVE